jgi:hypothetical protein
MGTTGKSSERIRGDQDMVGEPVEVEQLLTKIDFFKVKIGGLVYLVEVEHKEKEIDEVKIHATEKIVTIPRNYIKIALAILREGYKV